MSKRRILGIDPALGTTGYGVIEVSGSQCAMLDAGVIRCDKNQSLECRLHELFCGIKEVLEEFQPHVFAIEQLYSHYERPTTAILMGHARGAIMLAAANSGLKVHSYAATQVKKTLTGNGRAAKTQMQFAVKHQLGLDYVPEPADVADALAIALTHLHSELAAPAIASAKVVASQPTPQSL
ncbi:MAG TPA: crossover junction endodeoxyribonuclease RuvC [Planctomycetaceae bacterium]|nr:crossover junction endodeoxyribonuclease RuvC [Planctomycetaceae bacterium]